MSNTASSYGSTLQSYLSSSTPLDQAVQQLTQSLDSQAQDSNKPIEELNFEELWTTILRAAAKAPQPPSPNEPSPVHSKLLDLLAAIADSGRSSVWSGLQGFGAAAREVWNESPAANGSGFSVAEWAQLNAFAAFVTVDKRLGGAGKSSADFSLYGLWALRAALEDERPQIERDANAKGQVALDNWLPAAVAWLEVAGSLLYKLSKDNKAFVQPGQSPDPARVGAQAKDQVSKGGFSLERWTYWRESLKTLSEARDDAGGREKVAKLAWHGLDVLELSQ